MCLAVAIAAASAGHLRCGDRVSGHSGAMALHLTVAVAIAGAVTLAHVAGKHISHWRCASACIATHDLLEKLIVGGLGLCIGGTRMEVAFGHVFSSVSGDSCGSGKEREDDGFGE